MASWGLELGIGGCRYEYAWMVRFFFLIGQGRVLCQAALCLCLIEGTFYSVSRVVLTGCFCFYMFVDFSWFGLVWFGLCRRTILSFQYIYLYACVHLI